MGVKTKMLLRVATPIVIGVTVFALLFHDDFSAASWSEIRWTPLSIWAIALAWLCMIGRDFGLTWRFRTLTGKDLSWVNAARVDLMCEFTSAITPTAVGGSAMGMVYLNHEGVNFGRAAILTMTTLFLDELFFVVACPIICLLLPSGALFGFTSGYFGEGIKLAFWIVYGGLVVWTSVLFIGIFLKPRAVKKVFVWLFSLKWLRRWLPAIEKMTDNLLATSDDLRSRKLSWWFRVFGATALSWCSRFLVVNALFMGLVPDAPQFVVFCRQFVIWVVLIVSPTPGGSGLSEWLFTEYYGDFVGGTGVALVVALLWRVVSYYIYLLLGLCILPSFLTPRKTLKTKPH